MCASLTALRANTYFKKVQESAPEEVARNALLHCAHLANELPQLIKDNKYAVRSRGKLLNCLHKPFMKDSFLCNLINIKYIDFLFLNASNIINVKIDIGLLVVYTKLTEPGI